MSRNGQGIYSLPAVYDVSDGDTSAAAQLTTPFEDLESDANTARPIVAGGTGATTAAAARSNLGANSATNLTTGTLDDARLSARIDALTHSGSSNDLNLITQSGFYSADSADANKPGDAGNWTVFHMARSATIGTQLAISRASSAIAYRWTATGSTGWSDWNSLLSQTEQAALWAALTDLASTASGKGASLVGVQDSAANFSGTTVEAVLAELASRALGRTLTDHSASGRVAGTVYQNTSDRTMLVGVRFRSTSSNAKNMLVGSANPPTVVVATGYPSGGDYHHATFPVPPDWYYATQDSGVSVNVWWELS